MSNNCHRCLKVGASSCILFTQRGRRPPGVDPEGVLLGHAGEDQPQLREGSVRGMLLRLRGEVARALVNTSSHACSVCVGQECEPCMRRAQATNQDIQPAGAIQQSHVMYQARAINHHAQRGQATLLHHHPLLLRQARLAASRRLRPRRWQPRRCVSTVVSALPPV